MRGSGWLTWLAVGLAPQGFNDFHPVWVLKARPFMLVSNYVSVKGMWLKTFYQTTVVNQLKLTPEGICGKVNNTLRNKIIQWEVLQDAINT